MLSYETARKRTKHRGYSPRWRNKSKSYSKGLNLSMPRPLIKVKMSIDMLVGGVRGYLRIKRNLTFIGPVDTESKRSVRIFLMKALSEIRMSHTSLDISLLNLITR